MIANSFISLTESAHDSIYNMQHNTQLTQKSDLDNLSCIHIKLASMPVAKTAAAADSLP